VIQIVHRYEHAIWTAFMHSVIELRVGWLSLSKPLESGGLNQRWARWSRHARPTGIGARPSVGGWGRGRDATWI